MSDDKKYCEECGNPMTLLLTTYVCDWCDGLVEDEWNRKEDQITQPMFFNHNLPSPDDYYDYLPYGPSKSTPLKKKKK